MTNQLRFAALTCLSFCLTDASTAKVAAAEPSVDLQLTIRLYDYAKLDSETLTTAQQELDEILGKSGIGVSWLGCATSMDEAKTNRACASKMVATDIVLRLLRPEMTPGVSSEIGTFGVALVGPEVKLPRTASVLLKNVERLGEGRHERMDYSIVHRSFSDQVFLGRLLGYVMAHEVGHLLQNSSKHTSGGIMRGHWDVNVTARALTRSLHFSQREVKRIRAEVQRRTLLIGPTLGAKHTALTAPFVSLDAAAPARLPDHTERLTILVQDMAETDPRTVEGAIQTARRILAEAGVDADWFVCPDAQHAYDRPAACGAQPGPWALRMRLISDEKARLLPLAQNNFGVALPGKAGALGSLAYVFAERTQLHARRIKVAEDILLGHMMAHELGHLLLGESSHAASGIMTARFKARHLQAAGQGGLVFFNAQARAMRAQVAQRLASRQVGMDGL